MPDPFGAVCTTADVFQVLGRNNPFGNSPSVGIALLLQRIGACKSDIAKFIAGLSPPVNIARNPPGLPPLPLATPNPTFPTKCSGAPPKSNDALAEAALYSILTYCVKWIATNAGASPTTTPTPAPIGLHTPPPGSNLPWAKAIYVLSLASDANVAAQTSLQLANLLRSPAMYPDVPSGTSRPPQRDLYSDRVVRYNVIAAPAWKLSDYQQACFNDPSTAGAIVALQPGSQSNAVNAVFFGWSYTSVNMQFLVLDCEPTTTAYVNNAAYVVWLSHVRSGTGVRYYTNLASLLGALAIGLAVHPTKMTTYAIRKPKDVKHGETYESGYTITSAGAAESAAAIGVTGVFANVNIGQLPSPDGQTADAIRADFSRLIDDLMWTCTYLRPGYNEFPQPQCAWFSYRPKKQPPP